MKTEQSEAMTIKLYYLDGLGGNIFYADILGRKLGQEGIEMVYLPLPGHPGALDISCESCEQLLAWFEDSIRNERAVYLMGYSLGADLAAYLAFACSKVKKLVLLDGGIWDLSTYPLEQELTDTQAYLDSELYRDLTVKIKQEQSDAPSWATELDQAIRLAYVKNEAGLYHLNLNTPSIFALLGLRRQVTFSLGDPNFQTDTLLLLADSPEAFYKEKCKQIAKIPHQFVEVHTLPQSTHQAYLECPVLISRLVKVFLVR